MVNTIFIDAEGHITKTSSMRDEHQFVKITEKTPEVKNIGKIVCGDINSNILTFEINRYYDGVDLYTKNIKFIVKNELGTFTEDAVNLQYNSELLRFSWILSDSVTYKSGTITAAIIFLGTESGNNYALKTIPFNIKIDNSLDFLDIEPPHKNWFVDIEARLLELENNGVDGRIHISAEQDNAIIEKEDGLFVKDENERITAAETKLATIKAYQNFVNTELEYGAFEVEEENREIDFSTDIPFTKIVAGNILVSDDQTIFLKAGKTYEINLHIYGNVYIGNNDGAAKYGIYSKTKERFIDPATVSLTINPSYNTNQYYVNNCSLTIIYSPETDEQIKVRRVSTNETAKLIKVSAGTNLVIKEIARPLIVNPLAYDDELEYGFAIKYNGDRSYGYEAATNSFHVSKNEILKDFTVSENFQSNLTIENGYIKLHAGKLYALSADMVLVSDYSIAFYLLDITNNIKIEYPYYHGRYDKAPCTGSIVYYYRPETDCELSILVTDNINFNNEPTNFAKFYSAMISVMEIKAPINYCPSIGKDELDGIKQNTLEILKADTDFINAAAEAATQSCKDLIKAGYREVLAEDFIYGTFENYERVTNPVRGTMFTGNWKASGTTNGKISCDENGVILKGGKSYMLFVAGNIYDADNVFPHAQINFGLKNVEKNEIISTISTIVGPGTANNSTDRCAVPIYYSPDEDCHIIPVVTSDPSPCTTGGTCISCMEILQPLITEVQITEEEKDAIKKEIVAEIKQGTELIESVSATFADILEQRISEGSQSILDDPFEWGNFYIPDAFDHPITVKMGDIISDRLVLRTNPTSSKGNMSLNEAGHIYLKGGKHYLIEFSYRYRSSVPLQTNLQLWDLTNNYSLGTNGIVHNNSGDMIYSNKCSNNVLVHPDKDIEIGIKAAVLTKENGENYSGSVDIDILSISIIEQKQSVVNNISNEIYSEEEKLIGKWIDGKNLYQKVIVKEYDENSTSISIPFEHNIQNVDTIFLSGDSFAQTYAGNSIPLSRFGLQDKWRLNFFINAAQIYSSSEFSDADWGTYHNSIKVFFIVKYTKTNQIVESVII